MTLTGLSFLVLWYGATLGESAAKTDAQIAAGSFRINERVATNLVAGDTNDWSGVPTGQFSKRLGLQEAFKSTRGRHARTFPSKAPMLCLDRIYVRGLAVKRTEVFFNGHWAKLSDHAALMTEVAG